MAGANRPPYWSPEYVLEEMREGRTVSELIRAGISDLGGEEESPPQNGKGKAVPVYVTWWNDIKKWRRQVPGFDDAYQEAIEQCYEVRGEDLYFNLSTGRPPGFGPAQQVAFLQEMALNGGELGKAAYDCGVAPATVLNLINPKSPAYSKDFADRFYMAEAARGATLYEAVWEEAMTPDDKGHRNAILLRHLSETRLSHLFNAKKVVEIEGLVRHQHELLPAGVTRQLADTRRALLGPGETPVGDVVDVDFEVVEAEP